MPAHSLQLLLQSNLVLRIAHELRNGYFGRAFGSLVVLDVARQFKVGAYVELSRSSLNWSKESFISGLHFGSGKGPDNPLMLMLQRRDAGGPVEERELGLDVEVRERHRMFGGKRRPKLPCVCGK